MKFSRRAFLKAALGVLAGSCGAVLAGYGGYQYGLRIETKLLDIERVRLPIKGLKSALEGLKIVQMSDIHLHPFTQIDFVRQAVEMTNQLKPDLVALTGDYVLQSADSIFELAPVLASLNPKYGIFAAIGNHDIWTDVTTVQTGLEESGLTVLVNEGVLLDIGGEPFYMAGVDDAWSGRPDLKAALENLPAGVPTILLAHEPDLADDYSLDGRVSLQLSGHTHGGQVRLPGYGALVLPPFGRKYALGLYRVNDTWVYTNRGLGVIGPPVRINCRPEITEITLIRG
ncbi:MAG: metallophosphoesterase [Anaerolineae bacterium]|nr:metallophosphoesterase [Anaerolineae bacterium]